MPKLARAQRGNAILFVTIMLAVLALIGVATVEFTGRDRSMAQVHQRTASVERCTTAARDWIVSQYRVGGADVPSGAKLQVTMDGLGDSVSLVADAHLDGSLDAAPRQPSPQLGGAIAPLQDRTAVIMASRSLGGGIYTAVCKDGTGLPDGGGGRAFEVEFAFEANR